MLIREVGAEELESGVAARGGASETRGKEGGLVTCVCCLLRDAEGCRKAASMISIVFSEPVAILSRAQWRATSRTAEWNTPEGESCPVCWPDRKHLIMLVPERLAAVAMADKAQGPWGGQ